MGTRAPGKGEAVGEGNHSEALEAKQLMTGPRRADHGGQEEIGLGTVCREPNSNPGDPLDSARSKACGNFPSLAVIMNKLCSLTSSLYPVLQPSLETMSFPKRKWERLLWPSDWNVIISGCDRHRRISR